MRCSVNAADFDGGGDLDIVAASFGTDALVVFRQVQPSVFETSSDDVLSDPVLIAGPRAAVAVDLDGDGDVELVSANDGNNVTILFGGC